jgi:N-acetylglucosamine-6-phosphate deacetylase
LYKNQAHNGFKSVEELYGADNVTHNEDWLMGSSNPGVRIITAAPEVDGMMESISELNKRGIVFSIGHR